MSASKCAKTQRKMLQPMITCARKPEAASAKHKDESAGAIFERDLVESQMSDVASHGTPAKPARKYPRSEAGDGLVGQLRRPVTHRAQNW
jgi:hypothetical protein